MMWTVHPIKPVQMTRSARTLAVPEVGLSAGFKYVEALGRIIIGGPYPVLNAIIYMHLQL